MKQAKSHFIAAATLCAATYTNTSQAEFVSDIFRVDGTDAYNVEYDNTYALFNQNTILYYPDTMTARGATNPINSSATSIIFSPIDYLSPRLEAFRLFLDGDHSLGLFDDGSLTTTIFIRDLDAPLSTPPEILTYVTNFSDPADFEYWSAYNEIDVTPYSGSFSVTIQNTLAVDSNSPNSFIQIKHMAVSPIPVPATAWLFFSACAGLVVARKRAPSNS